MIHALWRDMRANGGSLPLADFAELLVDDLSIRDVPECGGECVQEDEDDRDESELRDVHGE